MTLTWRKKLLFASITTLGFFLLLEGALVLVGVRPVIETRDPFVGFAKQIPLFVEEKEGGGGEVRMLTAENKLMWFNDQSFLKKKPKGVYRIFCVGGSTTYGRPYRDITSFAGWLRGLLPRADARRQWEVINAGGVSYASYRVASVMEELARYEPDLFIVYSAQNEFLERRTYEDMFKQPDLALRINSILSQTRTWALVDRVVKSSRGAEKAAKAANTLPGEVDEMLNHTIGPSDYQRDEQWRAKVLEHYEFNLERMVRIARGAGAKLVLVTPASNLRDCSPFKSVLAEQVGDDDALRFKALVEEAHALAGDDKLAEGLKRYRSALEIDPRHADALYQTGRLLFRLGQKEEARRVLQRALDEDVCPLRAVKEIPEAIHRVAERMNVPCVDFEQLLSQLCREEYDHDCLGGEYFLDHVHPNIEGHRRLALWLIEALVEQGIVKTDPEWGPDAVDQVTDSVRSQIDEREHGYALKNLAKVLHWAGKFAEAAPIAEMALEHLQNDAECLYLMGDCLRLTGREVEAIAYLRRLVDQDVTAWRGHVLLGGLLAERGRLKEAKTHLQVAAELEPDDHTCQRELGLVLARLGEFEASLKPLEAAFAKEPESAPVLYHLGVAHAETGKTQEAVKLLRAYVEAYPGDAFVHNRLGVLLLDDGRTGDAIKEFEKALKLNPNYEEADINLGIAKTRLKQNRSGASSNNKRAG